MWLVFWTLSTIMSIKIHHYQNPLMFNPPVMLNPLTRVLPCQNSIQSLLLSITVKGLDVMFIWEVECSLQRVTSLTFFYFCIITEGKFWYITLFMFQVLELDTPANLMSNPNSEFKKMMSTAGGLAKWTWLHPGIRLLSFFIAVLNSTFVRIQVLLSVYRPK